METGSISVYGNGKGREAARSVSKRASRAAPRPVGSNRKSVTPARPRGRPAGRWGRAPKRATHGCVPWERDEKAQVTQPQTPPPARYSTHVCSVTWALSRAPCPSQLLYCTAPPPTKLLVAVATLRIPPRSSRQMLHRPANLHTFRTPRTHPTCLILFLMPCNPFKPPSTPHLLQLPPHSATTLKKKPIPRTVPNPPTPIRPQPRSVRSHPSLAASCTQTRQTRVLCASGAPPPSLPSPHLEAIHLQYSRKIPSPIPQVHPPLHLRHSHRPTPPPATPAPPQSPSQYAPAAEYSARRCLANTVPQHHPLPARASCHPASFTVASVQHALQ